MLLEHWIQQKIESWVEQGRNSEVIEFRGSYLLNYGKRFRLQCTFVFAVTVTFCVIGEVAFWLDPIDDRRLMITLHFLSGLSTVLTGIYLLYVLTSRVLVQDDSIAVHCFGMTVSECRRDEIVTTYRSPIHPSVVLQERDGKKTRISTQFDGLKALVAWLNLCTGSVLTDSIIDWMYDEAPDLSDSLYQWRGHLKEQHQEP